MFDRPTHFELHRHGETPHGHLGLHLRFTRMRGDVTCRMCLRYLASERAASLAREAQRASEATCASCGRRHALRPAYVGYEADALCATCEREREQTEAART